MRRVAVIASASGSGKTTLGRAVAARLGVPFLELDALVHGRDWVETPDAELRAQVEPVVRSDGWVIDDPYERKLGTLVLDAADTVVWLDLPARVWLRRLARRTTRRLARRERLWNDNRETLRNAFWGRESLFGFALLTHSDAAARVAGDARRLPGRATVLAGRGRRMARGPQRRRVAPHATGSSTDLAHALGADAERAGQLAQRLLRVIHRRGCANAAVP